VGRTPCRSLSEQIRPASQSDCRLYCPSATPSRPASKVRTRRRVPPFYHHDAIIIITTTITSVSSRPNLARAASRRRTATFAVIRRWAGKQCGCAVHSSGGSMLVDASTRHTLQWAASKVCASSRGRCEPHLGLLVPHASVPNCPKRHLDRFSRFCRAQSCTEHTETGTQTES